MAAVKLVASAWMRCSCMSPKSDSASRHNWPLSQALIAALKLIVSGFKCRRRIFAKVRKANPPLTSLSTRADGAVVADDTSLQALLLQLDNNPNAAPQSLHLSQAVMAAL
eukprot:CAMPEP_0198567854 /NCGR_PEP_ID=MMETSP1462-20131121/105462_1 /TAXON_ID=1333877 /ORGANISM="Brandtodinium nutriculum, Strain RCC3387" /LENGTH=109 /DNA_ID=CAMNT_0044298909 /DNA_START=103 /DNA_END=432 /DNA_ORIENTATION=-